MKKILIVDSNLEVGGIQKSLINFLNVVSEYYDVSLALFYDGGALYNRIPKNVEVIRLNKLYYTVGLSKNKLKKHPLLFACKAVLILFTKITSKRSAMRLIGIQQNKLGDFDVAISYSHLSAEKDFRSCTGEFVLDKVVASKKVCFIHCDYAHSGTRCEYNDNLYQEFDNIICCSNSVKNAFDKELPKLSSKTSALRNFLDPSFEEMLEDDCIRYAEDKVNLISVARLSKEKGLERAIEALYKSQRNDIIYYLVGDGIEKDNINNLILKYSLQAQVVLCGEQRNPQYYMKNADYLIVPSYHEAAPMIFDEAHQMGLSIISTNTLSANEMLFDDIDIVCKNDDELINALKKITKKKKKKKMKASLENMRRMEQITEIFT